MQKIMIIDDDQQILTILGLFLRRHGFRPIAVSDSTRAIDIAIREDPDIIIVDLRMPGMDGNAINAALSNIPSLRNTPVILLTAQTSVEPATAQGWAAVLRKPVELNVLLETINSFLARVA